MIKIYICICKSQRVNDEGLFKKETLVMVEANLNSLQQTGRTAGSLTISSTVLLLHKAIPLLCHFDRKLATSASL